MDPAIVASLAIGFISTLATVIIFFAATRAARIQAREASRDRQKSIDAQAYDRAKSIYESAIEQLNHEIKRCRMHVTELGIEIVRLQEQVSSLRRTNAEMLIQLESARKL